MQDKVAFLVDERCDLTTVGIITSWVHSNVVGVKEVLVIQANVQRWFRERVHPIVWLTKKEIVGASHNSDEALQMSIEHIRQLIDAPWQQLEKAVGLKLVDFTGEWDSLCHFSPVPKRGDACRLNPACYGDCCEEWQAAHAAFAVALDKKVDGSHSAVVEFKLQTKRLFGKLAAVQTGDAPVLVLMGDCWETVYKMRTSMYVSALLNRGVYVCGVSLSETEKALTELPNFTVHAPGLDFKDGLLYDIKEALERETGGKEKNRVYTGDGQKDSKPSAK